MFTGVRLFVVFSPKKAEVVQTHFARLVAGLLVWVQGEGAPTWRSLAGGQGMRVVE